MSRKRVSVLPAVLAAGLLAIWPLSVNAQHRGGGHGHVSVVVGAGVYNPWPYYYDAFWGGPWGWYQSYPWGPNPPYPAQAAGWDNSAAKILVTPKQTEVYVDGYLVGVADDFDGTFQSLRLPAGDHEIQLYLEGYRTVRKKVAFRPGETYKLRLAMEKLPPGEPNEPKPVPTEPPEAPSFPEPRAPRLPGDRSADVGQGAGTLSIRVQPANADVFIDGERWEGPGSFDRLDVQVPEGAHRVEVRKDGYESFSTDVRVHRGEVLRLNISLPRAQRP